MLEVNSQPAVIASTDAIIAGTGAPGDAADAATPSAALPPAGRTGKKVPPNTDNPSSAIGSEAEEQEHDLERLQSDVTEVVQKIHHCRSTLPDQLRNTLHSLLSANRPISHPASTDPDAERHDGVLLAEEDKETAEKIQLLRQKIFNNVSAMPIFLKRMKECISRIDDFNSHSRIIHPTFKRRRTS